MRIAVIGAGSWGTALANLLAGKGYEVTLWAYEAELVERLRATRINDLFLPGIELDSRLLFTNDLATAVAGRQVVVLVSPSQVMRSVVRQLQPHLGHDSLLVSAAKGIENDTLRLMSEVLEEELGQAAAVRCAYLSGPSFAREVAIGLPTAVTVAALEPEVGRCIQKLFHTDFFRVYTNADVVGVELGGALKNVIALAAGVSDGLGFGHNARAALINRGLVEMARLGAAKGAEAETFAGLAGMGDLVLTCTGDLSRNRTVGIELGKGRTLSEIVAGMHMVAEGVKTTLSAWQLAQKLGVAMPITEQMYRILYENKSPRQAVSELMQRQQRSEGA